MAMGSAAIATPIFMKMGGMVPKAQAAERTYDFVDKKGCDLVVLGGGGSGLVAAVRTAQLTGKKVIVLEKAPFIGGGAQMARTIRTFGSKWQAKRNLPDTTDAYAKEMMEWMYWWLDEKLVGNCLRGTGQFFDWLCEEGDNIEDNFTPGKYVFAVSENEPIGPQIEDREAGNGFGRFVMNMMTEKCKTYGVEVLTKHKVVDVEMKDGKIVSAVAKSDAGYVQVTCKACILATGSWISNKEVVKKYVPNYYQATQYMEGMEGQSVGHTSKYYTGDGIALAEKIGAFVDYDSFCVRPMGPTPGTGHGDDGGKVKSAMAQTPFIITINSKGKRYSCESIIMNLGFFNGGSVLMRQPGAQSWDIFDENALAAALKYQKLPENEKVPRKKVELVPHFEAFLPDTMEEIRNDLKEHGADFIMAGTLEELADKIGVDKKNFLETVKKYNEGCKTGIDEFFKNKAHLTPINKAPFYAYKGRFGTDGAFGGVRVNHEMQAYRADRSNLVEGLYVTGDFATGKHINVNGVKWQVINDLSWAFSSGFLAGTNAAKYLESLG